MNPTYVKGVVAGLFTMTVDSSIEEIMKVKVKHLLVHNGTNPVFVLSELLKKIQLEAPKEVRVLSCTVTLKDGTQIPQHSGELKGVPVSDLMDALSSFSGANRVETIVGVVTTGIGWQEHFQLTDVLAYSFKGIPGFDHRVILPGAAALVDYLNLKPDPLKFNRAGISRRHLAVPKTFIGMKAITEPPKTEPGDRIMTLPSGRKVVLKGIDHDTLAELHVIKTAGVEAMKKEVSTIGSDLMKNYLAGLVPQTLHDNARTIMEEAVVDPLLGAAKKFPVSAERQRMFNSTTFGQLIRRADIRANLRSRGLPDKTIDKVFDHLQENGIDLYLFDPDNFTWEATPATTVFDAALESFNKKAKKKGKKIKQ